MKRNVKNIIMIGVIALALIGLFLTMNYAKNNSSTNYKIGTPPDMQDMEKRGNPKEKNNDNNSNKFGDKKNSSNKKSHKQNMLPDTAQNEENTPPDITNEKNELTRRSVIKNNGNLSSSYYVIFGVFSFIIASTIIYLIMSNMNKKSFKEVFNSNNKKVISVLMIILLTSCLTFLSGYITNNYFLTNTSNKDVKDNMDNRKNSSSQGSITYSSNKDITSDDTISSGTYTSNTADENTISATGKINVNLSNIEVNKSGNSDGGDNTSFYGTNSAIIAKDGATLNISNATISTDATGANGVFSYGGSATTNNSNSDGTTINISDSTITTLKGNSGGIMTTGGGTTNAKNLTITTSGQSSAAIRSDRGGGTVNVDGGTYTSNGVGSPAIYSTADITVKNAKLISTTSEGVIIEGKNSITLENVELTDSNIKNVKSKMYKNIFIYQSMSGDAAEGVATFTAKDSTITTNNGDSIYVSNTSAVINLTNNKFINNDSSGYFLRAQKDSWGKEGSNGGKVTLNLTNQEVNGNIGVDEISSLTMNMSSSTFKGTIDAKDGNVSLKLDKDSKITLTGDSYITSLENADLTNSNINFNGYKLYVNNKAIN